MTESSGRIVVFGATGHVGRAITRLLTPADDLSAPQTAAVEAKTAAPLATPSLQPQSRFSATSKPNKRARSSSPPVELREAGQNMPADSPSDVQWAGQHVPADSSPDVQWAGQHPPADSSPDVRWAGQHPSADSPSDVQWVAPGRDALPTGKCEELLLVGRDGARLTALADDMGGKAATVVADLTDPRSLRGILRPGDVVVSTAGPFQRVGSALLDAVVESGAFYLDSSCEPAFVRHVFENYATRAAESGAILIPACGYTNLAGSLAGALALDEARGGPATRVDVAYFLGGGSVWAHATSGVLEAIAESLGRPGYAFRSEIVDIARPVVRDFTLMDMPRMALTVGAAEHYTLPRLYPSLQEVDVYVGLLGGLATRLIAGAPRPLLVRGGRTILRVMARRARGRDRRSMRTARVAAFARDSSGQPLAEVHLSGSDPHDFTAGILAWCACQLLAGECAEVAGGVFGPVEIFGLGPLQVGCALAGISRLSG